MTARWLLPGLAALLAGCQTAPPTVAELLAMDDEALCQATRDDPLRLEAGAISANRGLRCHPAVVACDAIGLGPEASVEARRACIEAMMAQIREEQALAAERRRRAGLALALGAQGFSSTVQQLQRQQTICTPVGRSVVCQ